MDTLLQAIKSNDVTLFVNQGVNKIDDVTIIDTCFNAKAYVILEKLIKTRRINSDLLSRGFYQASKDVEALQFIIRAMPNYYKHMIESNFINGIVNVDVMKLAVEKVAENKQQSIFDEPARDLNGFKEYPRFLQAFTYTPELLEWWLNYKPDIIKWFNEGFGNSNSQCKEYRDLINNPKYVTIFIKYGLNIKLLFSDGNSGCPFCNDPRCLNMLYKYGVKLNIEQKLKITDIGLLREFQKGMKLIHYRNPEYVKMVKDDIKKAEEKRLIDEEWIDCVNLDNFDKLTEIKDISTINNYDKYGKTALIYSIEQRKTKFTKFLISKGVNINIGGQVKQVKLFKFVYLPDTRSMAPRTPEMEHIYSKKDKIFDENEVLEMRLLKVSRPGTIGENVGEDEDLPWKSPLTTNGHIQERGMPVVIEKCRYGVYPLMYAIENCDIQTIELLIDNGADLLVTDGEGIDIMGYVYKCQGIAQKDMRDLIKPLFDEARRSSRKTPKQQLLERIAEALEQVKDDDIVDQVRIQNEAIGSLLMAAVRKPI